MTQFRTAHTGIQNKMKHSAHTQQQGLKRRSKKFAVLLLRTLSYVILRRAPSYSRSLSFHRCVCCVSLSKAFEP